MPTRRALLASGLAAAAIAATIAPALAAEPPVFTRGGLAISGYDPVAYFTEGRPVEGSVAFAAEHEGATFHFASADNRDAFLADTAKFAPQYGGYCAYAVSRGYTAKTEPDAWSIVDDRLYLNFDKSVRALWAVAKRRNIEKADANWPSVLG
ncbi:MAG: YHS domain-containing (seleno)protein [Shimia sp.]